MAEAVAAYEEDKGEAQAELAAMDAYVLRAQEMVESEITWRKEAEAQFEAVRLQIETLEQENVQMRGETEEAAGALEKMSSVLEEERQGRGFGERKVAHLEHENGALKNKLDVVGSNSRLLLEEVGGMRAEGRVGEGIAVLGAVLGKDRVRRMARAWGGWKGLVEYGKGVREGKTLSQETAAAMERQLESTKVKLMVLKGALKEGGYIGKTPKKGGEGGGGRGRERNPSSGSCPATTGARQLNAREIVFEDKGMGYGVGVGRGERERFGEDNGTESITFKLRGRGGGEWECCGAR